MVKKSNGKKNLAERRFGESITDVCTLWDIPGRRFHNKNYEFQLKEAKKISCICVLRGKIIWLKCFIQYKVNRN